MKKHNPLSTAETRAGATSPRGKQWRPRQAHAGFTGGLAGSLGAGLHVPHMDTFIEKPFSVLSFRVCHRCKSSAKH